MLLHQSVMRNPTSKVSILFPSGTESEREADNNMINSQAATIAFISIFIRKRFFIVKCELYFSTDRSVLSTLPFPSGVLQSGVFGGWVFFPCYVIQSPFTYLANFN